MAGASPPRSVLSENGGGYWNTLPGAMRGQHSTCLRGSNGWQRGACGGWSAHVEQGRYGHAARKATWLYAFGTDHPPRLRWGKVPDQHVRSMVSWCRNHNPSDTRRRLGKREAKATPPEFRDLLLSIARSTKPCSSIAVIDVSNEGDPEQVLPNVSNENPGKTAGKLAPPGRFEHPAVDLEGRSHDEEAQRFQ